MLAPYPTTVEELKAALIERYPTLAEVVNSTINWTYLNQPDLLAEFIRVELKDPDEAMQMRNAPIPRTQTPFVPALRPARHSYVPQGLYAAWSLRRVVDNYRGPLAQIRTQVSGVFTDTDVYAGADGLLNRATIDAITSSDGHAWIQRLYDQTGNGRNITLPGGKGARCRHNMVWLTGPNGIVPIAGFIRAGDGGEVANFPWPGGPMTLSIIGSTDRTDNTGVFLMSANFGLDAGWQVAPVMPVDADAGTSAGDGLIAFNGKGGTASGRGVLSGFLALNRDYMSMDVVLDTDKLPEVYVNNYREPITGGVVGTPAAQTSTLTVGNIAALSSSCLGPIGEILIYNRALSSEDRVALWRNRHEYYFGPRIVVLDGGSHMEGHTNLDANPMNFMRPLLSPRWGVMSMAESGNTLDQMEAQSPYSVDRLPREYKQSAIIYGQWYNTMQSVGLTPTQMIAAAKAWALKRKAQGYQKVIFSTPFRVGAAVWGGQYTLTNIQAVRTSLYDALNAGEDWIDSIVDLYSVTEFQDPTNTTYFAGDQLHLSQAGLIIQAEMYAAATAALEE